MGNRERKLSEMSLEELWQLFPIFLTEHQECWKEWYENETASLHKWLTDEPVVRISHVGSTAVKDIWAKPIIDILVEVMPRSDMEAVKDRLTKNGYLCMCQDSGRMSFNKGYTERGFAEKVFHLHLKYAGDHDELYFRDYLNENPLVAKEYEQLKLSLWKQYEHDRDGYTDAKTEFVAEITRRAKERYGAIYCVKR